MSKTFRPYEPDQDFLMPVSMREWLPPDHLAYFISDVTDQLDLAEIMRHYESEERGYPPYHPRMMVKALLYAYCIGKPSSRKIAKRLEEDISFRVLAANTNPDFRTISDFRKDHLQVLAALFVQVLKLCQKSGLVRLGHVALDGTKIKANASKHKAMSYKRIQEEEIRLEREVAELLKRAEIADEEEDRRYGKGKRGDELPEELSFRESRLKKIREAKKALEEEAKREAADVVPEGKKKKHTGVPDNKAQRNFTDPDSHIMPAPGGKHFIQAYKAQIAGDSCSPGDWGCGSYEQAR
jgi:transposase